jgi:predicted DNA-binding transcriptional regulator AlpA
MHKQKQNEEFKLPLPEISGETLFPPREQLLTVAQTCRALTCCRRTLYKWSDEDKILPKVKLGYSVRFRLGDVLDLIEQFRTRAARKATSQISAFEKAMKARLAKEISKAA